MKNGNWWHYTSVCSRKKAFIVIIHIIIKYLVSLAGELLLVYKTQHFPKY